MRPILSAPLDSTRTVRRGRRNSHPMPPRDGRARLPAKTNPIRSGHRETLRPGRRGKTNPIRSVTAGPSAAQLAGKTNPARIATSGPWNQHGVGKRRTQTPIRNPGRVLMPPSRDEARSAPDLRTPIRDNDRSFRGRLVGSAGGFTPCGGSRPRRQLRGRGRRPGRRRSRRRGRRSGGPPTRPRAGGRPVRPPTGRGGRSAGRPGGLNRSPRVAGSIAAGLCPPAGQRVERRADEQEEADDATRRVARQAEDQRAGTTHPVSGLPDCRTRSACPA